MKRWNASDPAASEAVRKIPSRYSGREVILQGGADDFTRGGVVFDCTDTQRVVKVWVEADWHESRGGRAERRTAPPADGLNVKVRCGDFVGDGIDFIVGKNFAGGSGVAEFRSHESLRRIGEQRVEGRSKRHCMYDEKLVVGEDEGDEFKESAGLIGADDENLWRVGIGIKIRNRDALLESVVNTLGRHTMLKTDRCKRTHIVTQIFGVPLGNYRLGASRIVTGVGGPLADSNDHEFGRAGRGESNLANESAGVDVRLAHRGAITLHEECLVRS